MAKRKKERQKGDSPPDILQQMDVFLNEQRADIIALHTILQTVIIRFLPETDVNEFFDEHEQQALNSLLAYEPRQRALIEIRVLSFFEDLRKWYRARKAIPPISAVH